MKKQIFISRSKHFNEKDKFNSVNIKYWLYTNYFVCPNTITYCWIKHHVQRNDKILLGLSFLRMFWNFISSLPVKRGGSLSFLVGTISNAMVMEIGWTDVGSGGYILVSCAKFQNILRNTTQVIIRHRVKILFSVISSPITLERQKWKSSKMKEILLSLPVK
jgi:two-component sensor histidine kinase